MGGGVRRDCRRWGEEGQVGGGGGGRSGGGVRRDMWEVG